MQTLFQVSERQYNNYQEEVLVDGTALSYHDVKLIIDVVSLDAGSTCIISVSPERSGQICGISQTTISDVGQYKIGGKYGQYDDVSYRVNFNMTGRMRMQIRVVGFNHLEDVPEII